MIDFLRLVGIFGLASLAYAQAAQPSAVNLAAQLGSGFESEFAQVNGTRLHYVRGGSGPALVLLHGFPEDWYEFRLVMPRLTKKFTVVAVDLRGVGESAPSETGYDTRDPSIPRESRLQIQSPEGFEPRNRRKLIVEMYYVFIPPLAADARSDLLNSILDNRAATP
jgi:pimeloyl-ACP methyl ester carboxylesterase